jgi:hypothetical protein
MRGFDYWTEALNPEMFNIPPDEDPNVRRWKKKRVKQ